MLILRTMLAATLLLMVFTATAPARAAEETVEVWKSPTCGCCSMWSTTCGRVALRSWRTTSKTSR
jgi:hypothetical protein